MLRFLLIALVLASPVSAQELLSYWNFNNVESTYSRNLFGAFKTSPAGYGEGYDSSKMQLSANTGSGAVFSKENIYVDLSQLTGVMGGPGSSSWGVFTDTGVNRVPYNNSYSKSDGGSFMTSPANADNHITFVLSSRGYDRLSLSYASRSVKPSGSSSKSEGKNMIQWSYSKDGITFTPIENGKTPEAFGKTVLNLSDKDGMDLTALDDQEKLYLRATFVFGRQHGSLALDNIQFTGSPIKKK